MIKKLPLLLVIIMALSLSVKAQSEVGIKAGLAFANNVAVSKADISSSDTKFKFGYTVGFFAVDNISDNFIFNYELLLTNKGFGTKETSSNPASTTNMMYINVPLLFGYRLNDNATFLLGPEFGYLVAAKTKYDGSSTNTKDSFDNKFDFGLAAAMRFSLSENVKLGFRYVHGLTSVIKDIKVPTSTTSTENVYLQNRTIEVALYYKF